MSLRAYAIWRDDFNRASGGLAGHLRTHWSLSVGQFDLGPDDASLTSPLDPVAVLIRGANRLNILVWHETVRAAGLDTIVIVVRDRWVMDGTAEAWVVEEH